ncbi:hypothetical protein FRB94_011941 [Tulasnella sp. JGI-2019a]|nr:hypothetical protein FRB94_011941 [Tulasnella sp. JGI-2019a]KAG8999067.1 hypothetical protein FRB93_013337 [Tulasnella sp. JGI-2019a]
MATWGSISARRTFSHSSSSSLVAGGTHHRDRSASDVTFTSDIPLLERVNLPSDQPNTVAKPPSEHFTWPDKTFEPTFNRRQAAMIGISNAIGTGLFLTSGSDLADAGPLGILLGYFGMSFVMYCIIVSYVEMVSVYPNCRGTIALSNRFVDPALGFAMGWNAWTYWGITISYHISAAVSLIRYWRPNRSLDGLWPSLAIVISIVIVLSSRWYGNIETAFVGIKVFGVFLLIIIGITMNFAHDFDPFKFWRCGSLAQYQGIPGRSGQALALMTGFTNALFPFLGCEVATYLAAEIKDAPRVLAPICKRTWIRVSILYLTTVFIAGTLRPPTSSTTPDQPWVSSSFWLAMHEKAGGYTIIAHLLVVCFLVSALSAAAVDVYMSTRILSFLAAAGHAPKWLGLVYRKKHTKGPATVIPWVGLITSLGFAALSFLFMAPPGKYVNGDPTLDGVTEAPGQPYNQTLLDSCDRWNSTMPLNRTKEEVFFEHLVGINQSAYLQAIIGTLFTYLRFYYGTKYKENEGVYRRQIKRIKENRSRGQPYLALSALCLCVFILLSRGWTCFRLPGGGRWHIYTPVPDQDIHWQNADQANSFLVTYLPPPILLLLVFGYKLVKRSRMTSYKDMDFSDVVFPAEDTEEPEPLKSDRWGRLRWILMK